MDRSQQGWLLLLFVAAVAFFYQGGEMLAKHSAWSEFTTPAGVGEIFMLLAAVTGAVAAALKIDLPGLMQTMKGGR